jgi:hypothetical protein
LAVEVEHRRFPGPDVALHGNDERLLHGIHFFRPTNRALSLILVHLFFFFLFWTLEFFSQFRKQKWRIFFLRVDCACFTALSAKWIFVIVLLRSIFKGTGTDLEVTSPRPHNSDRMKLSEFGFRDLKRWGQFYKPAVKFLNLKVVNWQQKSIMSEAAHKIYWILKKNFWN